MSESNAPYDAGIQAAVLEVQRDPHDTFITIEMTGHSRHTFRASCVDMVSLRKSADYAPHVVIQLRGGRMLAFDREGADPESALRGDVEVVELAMFGCFPAERAHLTDVRLFLSGDNDPYNGT